MVIPGRIHNVDKTDTPFHHASCQQAVASETLISIPQFASPLEILLFRPVNSVRIQSRLGFAGQIDQFRSGRLHPVGQFIGRNTRGNFRIMNFGVTLLIGSSQSVQALPLQLRRHPGRIGQVQDRFSLITKEDSGVCR